MTMTQSGGALERPSGSDLANIIDTILDKGLVIDAYVRVSLVGIDALTIDARVVIASVDTYLRFAEAVGRLNLEEQKEGLPGMFGQVQEGGAEKKLKGATKGVLDAAGEKVQEFAGDGSGSKRARRRK
ncbi:MAG: gas vesicle protein [Acidimicrobiaceae bacterium]|nr:gas vesicle protein [Acidimicrobiaceae bacterium]